MSEDSAEIHHVAISLGSNVNPEENLKAAIRELNLTCQLLRVSRVWESPPAGFREQANFLNAAVLLATPFSAAEFKQSVLRPIEARLGRVRDPENVNAPRTIDLDISIFLSPSESQVFDEEILTRGFVAVPLAEVLPDFVHPQTGQTLAEIAALFQAPAENLKLRKDCQWNRHVPPMH